MSCIYIAINKVNGKIYIGKTSKTVEERKKGHLKRSKTGKAYFCCAIRKYGIDGFDWKVLEDTLIENLNERERLYIQKYKSNDPDIGYNLTAGGDGGKVPISDDGRRRISEKNRNRPAWNKDKKMPPGTGEKMSKSRTGQPGHMLGHHQPEKSKKALSDKMKGQFPNNKGKKSPPSTRKKRSVGLKNYWNEKRTEEIAAHKKLF